MPRQANPAKALLKNIDTAHKAVKAADRELKEQLDLLLKNHAPVKKGDVIKVNDSYSHVNKPMTVDRVVIHKTFGGDYIFKVTGFVNKSDGTPGKFRGESTFGLKDAK